MPTKAWTSCAPRPASGSTAPTCAGRNATATAKANAACAPLLAPYPPEGIHLIDSGDYHYVTKLWTDKIDHPFSLIVFDHHPDMQPPLFEGLLSCGCWVRTVLDTNPHVQKVCIVGATEKLKQETAGYDGRLVYFSEQTLCLREAWHVFSRLWLNEPVYISIDKDVLTPRQATTNWDQGSLSLGQLESLLRVHPAPRARHRHRHLRRTPPVPTLLPVAANGQRADRQGAAGVAAQPSVRQERRLTESFRRHFSKRPPPRRSRVADRPATHSPPENIRF